MPTRPATAARFLLAAVVLGPWQPAPADEARAEHEKTASRKLRELGGYVFLNLKTGRVREVNLNRNVKVRDAHLKHVAAFAELTDLSLEETPIGDAGIAKIAGLKKLEWLNLYRSAITDKALKSIGKITSLTDLPIGETDISDAGLRHLRGLENLHYLGVRGNGVTDKGAAEIARLKSLRRLHLGQTEISDVAIGEVVKLARLEELWLHDTRVTDDGIARLAGLKSLRRLHLQRTSTTAAAVKALREALPKCEIFWEGQSKPER